MILSNPMLTNRNLVDKFRTVVRLRTTSWHDFSGIYLRKNLTFLKRKSEGFNVVLDDCNCMSAEEVIPRIINFDSCKDGIYEIIVNGVSRDWETGYVEDWDYKLIPYKEDEK